MALVLLLGLSRFSRQLASRIVTPRYFGSAVFDPSLVQYFYIGDVPCRTIVFLFNVYLLFVLPWNQYNSYPAINLEQIEVFNSYQSCLNLINKVWVFCSLIILCCQLIRITVDSTLFLLFLTYLHSSHS